MFQPFLSFYQRADLSWKIELGYVWPNTQGAILCRVSARWKTLDVSRHSGLVKKRNKNTSGICPSSLHPLRSKKLDVAFRNIYIYSCNRLESSSSATFSVKRNWKTYELCERKLGRDRFVSGARKWGDFPFVQEKSHNFFTHIRLSCTSRTKTESATCVWPDWETRISAVSIVEQCCPDIVRSLYVLVKTTVRI